MLKDVLLCKAMLTINAVAVRAANTNLSPLITMGTQVLFVGNSIKLHLIAPEVQSVN